MKNITQIDDWLDSTQLICRKTKGKTKYDCRIFTRPLKFTSKIYCHHLMLQETKDDQQELKILINKLNNDHSPRNETKINERNNVLKSAKKLFFYKRRDYYSV